MGTRWLLYTAAIRGTLTTIPRPDQSRGRTRGIFLAPTNRAGVPAEYSSPRPIARAYPQNIPRPDRSRGRTRGIFLAPTDRAGVLAEYSSPANRAGVPAEYSSPRPIAVGGAGKKYLFSVNIFMDLLALFGLIALLPAVAFMVGSGASVGVLARAGRAARVAARAGRTVKLPKLLAKLVEVGEENQPVTNPLRIPY
eukprot:1195390-Prorocentrum_minimum.AAC.5